MNIQSATPSVRHDPATRRFLAEADGEQAELCYRLEGGLMLIDHTLVPQAIGGRGIAGELVRTAFEHARQAGLRVVPACPYAATWVTRHPEFADTLAG
ncbi:MULTISPECIES: GNAT family N-acetyltransferase [Pseudoxanthomonas]|jgi:Predicted acetyltransferase|uniref:N-acetyltransferase domain-containing protein n=1 Tax=Pseudoxanthomonas taiwanensis J19 TaxID=935569 RepID=A0A562D6R4_9GAMM|nr:MULTISPECIES: GNAT family N-acetyltransferase [Pseudoxanthomonas]TWH05455.1 hypothetical protein L613_000600000480 [Pseudoxanthomonas taiwanensis J19]